MPVATEFDEFSDDYKQRLDKCVRVSGQDADYFANVKANLLDAEMRHVGVDPKEARVLDLGCGTGSNSCKLYERVGQLVGSDVSGDSLPSAQRAAPTASFVHTDDTQLPFRDASFDAVLISCVLHHIPLDARLTVMREVARVLTRDGIVFVVEHNPYNPVTRWIVNRCEFDDDAILLTPKTALDLVHAAGFGLVRRRHILFVPGTSKLVERINSMLHWLPMGAQYSVSARPGRGARSSQEGL